MANATLNPIYERLNNAPTYHPLTAETFADWSMEAGDLITISRDGNTYTSPVGTSRMVWRGSQQISIDSTGTREREPISRVSRKKFSRGGGTANNNAFFYNEIFSDDGEVHSVVQQTASTFSVEIGKRARVFESYEDPVRQGETVSPGDFWVKTNNVETWDEFTGVSWTYGSDFDWNDYKGALVYVRTEYGTWRLVSDQQVLLDHDTKIEQDENHISLIAQDVRRIDGNVEKNYAELRVESDRISSEVTSTRENLGSRIDQTAASIRSEVSTLDGNLSSSITQTASSIRSEVNDKVEELSSSITQTAASIRSEVSTLDGNLSSSITQTASSIRSEVNNKVEGLSSSITQTASSIRSEVSSSVSGLSSSITQTASSIRSEVSSSISGLSSRITQTASTFNVEVSKRARVFESYEDPIKSETVNVGDFWVKTNNIETWDEFTNVSWTYGSEFDWDDYKGAEVRVRTEYGTWRLVSNQRQLLDNTTKIDEDDYHISLIANEIERVDGNVYRNYSEFRVESDRITADVVNAREGLASQISQTASSIRAEVSTLDGNLSSSITQTASSIRSEVNNKVEGLSSSITQTASSIRSEVSSSVSGLSSSITQTASSIRSEVSSSVSGLSSSITQTASSIRSEVSSSVSGLSSRITQESNRISLVVDGSGSSAKIKPAEIVAAINNGESSIVISATHINLDGYVKATDITSDYINSKIAGITQINGLSAKFTGNVYASQFYLPKDNVSMPVSSAVRYLQITQSGNTYTLQKKSFYEDEWQNVGSFSRATSLSGAWSGVDYTVTASPQGNTRSIGFSASANERLTMYGGAVTPYASGNYNYVYKTVYIGTVNAGAAPTGRYSAEILVDTSSVYSAGLAEGWNGYMNDADWGIETSGANEGRVYRPAGWGSSGNVTWFNVHDYGYSKDGGTHSISLNNQQWVSSSASTHPWDEAGEVTDLGISASIISQHKNDRGYVAFNVTCNGGKPKWYRISIGSAT